MVMVVLEGFSMYHSRFFSGLADFTPNLDRIAANHTAFTRFWANGFTTENGLIALLGGQVPTPGPDQIVFGGGFAFDGFSDLPHSLPRQFGSHGYQSAFLTAGDLSFSGKGAWLDELGFDELIGHDDPFFDGWPRLHFNAAPDSALYLRALHWLDEQPRTSPSSWSSRPSVPITPSSNPARRASRKRPCSVMRTGSSGFSTTRWWPTVSSIPSSSWWRRTTAP